MAYSIQLPSRNLKNNPLAILWKGKCTIYEFVDTTDPDTHQTIQTLKAVVTDEPCRLSFSQVMSQSTTTQIVQGAAEQVQIIKLFLRPDITINAGSVIEVTQNGVTTKYKRSNVPAIYTQHQEVTLELYEERA